MSRRGEGPVRGEGLPSTRPECTEPHLGLATTREMLEELKARGEVASLVGRTHDRDHEGADGAVLYAFATSALNHLHDRSLAYRTVDSE